MYRGTMVALVVTVTTGHRVIRLRRRRVTLAPRAGRRIRQPFLCFPER